MQSQSLGQSNSPRVVQRVTQDRRDWPTGQVEQHGRDSAQTWSDKIVLQGFDGEIPDELRVRLGMLSENRGMVPEGQGEGEEVAEKRGRELLYVVLV